MTSSPKGFLILDIIFLNPDKYLKHLLMDRYPDGQLQKSSALLLKQ
jgi:hypothetical protein